MKIIAKRDAMVGSITVKKGENQVDEWVANTLRNAGILIEEPVIEEPKKVVKKTTRKRSTSKRKK